MMRHLLENVRRLQEYLLEVGLARSILALPAPRMLALPSPSSESSGPANVFARLITEAEVVQVARDLFASGHYSLAVQEAYKAIDKFVGNRIGCTSTAGVSLMDLAFSPSTPKLHWTDRKTQSEQDEQKGYHKLYAGAMQGVRNPVTHEFDWVDDPETALELLFFAQHLVRKAKSATVAPEIASRK